MKSPTAAKDRGRSDPPRAELLPSPSAIRPSDGAVGGIPPVAAGAIPDALPALLRVGSGAAAALPGPARPGPAAAGRALPARRLRGAAGPGRCCPAAPALPELLWGSAEPGWPCQP